MSERPIEILLVEDNPADAEIAREGFLRTGIRSHLQVAGDGEEALDFLYQRPPWQAAPLPDIILLDLNLPGLTGHQVLAHIKSDATLRHIPVIVLSSSQLENDVSKSYDLHANSFVTKPVGLQAMMRVVEQIEQYWFHVATLPFAPERT